MKREYGRTDRIPLCVFFRYPTPLSQTAAVTAPTSSRSWIDILGLGLSTHVANCIGQKIVDHLLESTLFPQTPRDRLPRNRLGDRSPSHRLWVDGPAPPPQSPRPSELSQFRLVCSTAMLSRRSVKNVSIVSLDEASWSRTPLNSPLAGTFQLVLEISDEARNRDYRTLQVVATIWISDSSSSFLCFTSAVRCCEGSSPPLCGRLCRDECRKETLPLVFHVERDSSREILPRSSSLPAFPRFAL